MAEVERNAGDVLEEFESDARTRRLGRGFALAARGIGAAISLLGLYWTQFSLPAHAYRASFLLLVLLLSFLLYPALRRRRDGLPWYDAALGLLALLSLGFLLLRYEQALQRVTNPTPAEVLWGAVLIGLVLEATRRTSGWPLPITALLFLLYAYLGPHLPEPFDHRGYRLPRIVGQNYLTLEGVFGTPLDVAATFIVLFTLYGAVLEQGGAGRFFIDWSFAALGRSRSGAGPGRTVTAAGFLLGTVSGSGVATTVTLGSLAWPMLKRAGYDRDRAGAILAAAGIGALLSPPTLGAAAFLIAEYLKITYLQVLVMATVPTILYYLSCLLMIEADARRLGTHAIEPPARSLGELTREHGYHFTSLVAVAALMVAGLTPFMAVFWSLAIAFALGFIRADTRLVPPRAGLAALAATGLALLAGQRPSAACFFGLLAALALGGAGSGLLRALEDGGRGVVSVAATTATAGVIVSVVTLTGLGLKVSGIIVGFAQGSTFLTVLFAALAVWLLGLAVPVTASYIIAAVMIVPALEQVGVAPIAAHMFIFYYAVLSDVSPPTALSPFAAAALTGGNPFRTMMLTWKYCLPAFLVPFMFTQSQAGLGLLLQGPPLAVVLSATTAAIGVAALAGAFGGYLRRPASLPERLLLGAAGLMLFLADARLDALGAALLAAVVAAHFWRTRHKVLQA
ncbi:MAG TPA: TRAP transporter fused permease subunit [Vicinamibacteria bacterium]|nr:TRAP transporter fused permease subunit [Vicinamibacteria bacterium]